MSVDISEVIPGVKDGTVTIDSKHLTNFLSSPSGTTVNNSISDVVKSPFVTRSKTANPPCFLLKGQPYKFVGFNYYPLLLPSTTTAQVRKILDAARRNGVTVMRAWCFDSPDAFRSLTYPVNTPNLITNGEFETDTSDWTLDAVFTRSNDVAHVGSYSLKQNSTAGTYGKATIVATVVANTNYVWTFWYQLTQTGGGQNQFPTRQIVGTTSGGSEIANGGILPAVGSNWTQRQMSFNSGNNTTVYLTLQNWGGTNLAYFDTMNLCVQAAPVITYNEASFVRVDVALNEARKRGIKLILSLADGNEDNYNTKGTYVSWANSIYGAGLKNTYPWLSFYTSSYCQQLYKDFIAKITQRVNTVNGLVYKNDPSIFSWELGNELRTNNFDPGNVVNTLKAPNLAILANPGGWADIMSTYIKTQDPNHLVNFGDMGHTWQYADGDTISNGTFYGVDYNIMSALPNIDFLDFHMYPNQADGIHLQKYGQRLGYPNSVSAAGFRAQLQDYVNVGHANGKPVVMSEIGFVSNTTGDNTYYTLYNRAAAFSAIFSDFLDTDGADGVVIWHAVAAATSGTYDIALNASGGEAVTDNSNDTTIIQLIQKYNAKLSGDIPSSSVETALQYAPAPYTYPIGTIGTLVVDAAAALSMSADIVIAQTPTGDCTFNAASVGNPGQKVTFVITTSGTSSFTLTFGTSFKSTGTLATGTSSGKVFTVTFLSDGTNYNEIARTTAM